MVDVAAAKRVVEETECAAALDGLHAIADTGFRRHVVLYGDNELLAYEYSGRVRPKVGIRNLDNLRRAADSLHFAHVDMVPIRREENKDAHQLARHALNEALIVRYGGRVEEFHLVCTCSGLYIHRYIMFPTPPVAVEAAGPIEEAVVLDGDRPRPGWNTIDLTWGGLKAAASQREQTRKTILSIVTPDGMLVGPEAESWIELLPPRETQNANNHWHRHALRDSIAGGEAD